MVGAALGADHDDAAFVPRGPLPLVFGGVSFVAGAVVGATQASSGSAREAALRGPGAMIAVAGGLPTIIDLAWNAATSDGNSQVRNMRRDLAIGMSVGLAAGLLTMAMSSNSRTHDADVAGVGAAPLHGGALFTYNSVF
jgi:hypothetical protein